MSTCQGNYLQLIKEPETPEEVDAILRAAGYDPATVGARMAAVAEKALKKKERDILKKGDPENV